LQGNNFPYQPQAKAFTSWGRKKERPGMARIPVVFLFAVKKIPGMTLELFELSTFK